MRDILLQWLTTLLLLGVGFPWAHYMFGERIPEAYGFARPLGFVLVGFICWILAVFGLVSFGATSILSVSIVLAVIGWLLGMFRGPAVPTAALWSVARSEIIFVCGAGVVLFFRTQALSLWDGEKPMDMALLQAVLKASTFPPQDPWMSGASVNYYYFGYVLAALPAAIMRSTPSVAYQLAFATTGGMVFAAVATLVASLLRVWNAAFKKRPYPGAHFFSLLGSILAVGVGNLSGFLQLLTGVPYAVGLTWADLRTALSNGIGARSPFTLTQPLTWANGTIYHTATPENGLITFNHAYASRAVWDTIVRADGVIERRFTITDFPLSSIFQGDLHPHFMVLPLTLLVLALVVRRLRAQVPTVVIPALCLAAVYITNNWDFPTLLVLYCGAIAWQSYMAQRPVFRVALELAGTVALTFLCIVPFQLHYTAPIRPSTELLLTFWTIPAQYIQVTTHHTETHALFIMFGVFFVPIMVAIASLVRTTFERVLLALCGVVALVAGSLGFVSLTALPLLFLITQMLLRRRNISPGLALWYLCVSLGALLLLFTDLFYLRDGENNRVNTVFKLFYQVWMFWGIAATCGVFLVWERAQPRRQWRAVLLLCVVPVLAAGLVYPAAVTARTLLKWRSPMLQSTTPRDAKPAGAKAIRWLRTHAQAGDVVVEAVANELPTIKNGASGVAALTGIPTVMGMPSHEYLWRRGIKGADGDIKARIKDIRTIYTSADAVIVQRLLTKYHVTYVYYATAEREKYGELPATGLLRIATPAFQSTGTVVYRVTP